MKPHAVTAHLKYFGELGVAGWSKNPSWRGRGAQASQKDAEAGAESSAFTGMESLEAIRSNLGECTRCKLSGLGRKQIVFGVGNPSAELMFVGEAPGRDEDTQGIPFVGRAGQLLTKIIAVSYTHLTLPTKA